MFLNGENRIDNKSYFTFDVIAVKNKPKHKGKLSLGSMSMINGVKFICFRRKRFYRHVFRGGHLQIQ